ncbi:hypothetical protein ACI2IX_04610 [Leifsonia aquatica]|uniref:hypothetical protein n=1 Tax=Leifsonia aquatica TaxID=144185 RepID=UPI00384F2100
MSRVGRAMWAATPRPLLTTAPTTEDTSRSPAPREAISLAWDLQALHAQNTFAIAANSTASFFNALAQHPDMLWEILGGVPLNIAAASGDSAVNLVQKQEGIDRGDGRDEYGTYAEGHAPPLRITVSLGRGP